MTKDKWLEKILHSYEAYYDIFKDEAEPFCARAEFHAHNEQYFFTKSAEISGSDSHEFVYFAFAENLDTKKLSELDGAAWTDGLKKTIPNYGHRNSDVTLVIIADSIEKKVFKAAKKIKHYKSYKFSLCGWNDYSLIAFSVSSGEFAFNSRGKKLQKYFSGEIQQVL